MARGPVFLSHESFPAHDEGAQSTLPCNDCDNHFPSGAPATKTFYEAPPVRIWLVRVPYAPTPGAAPNVPSQFDISMLASWLRRAYPTAEVRDTQVSMPTQARAARIRGRR